MHSVWSKGLAGAAPKLSVFTHHGTSRLEGPTAPARVVLTTYETLVSDHGRDDGTCTVGAFGVKWRRLVLDEAHVIRNRRVQKFAAVCALEAKSRWCFTGTPIFNGIGDIYPIVRFLRISPLHDYKVWNRLFARRHAKSLERVNLLLRAFVLPRTKHMQVPCESGAGTRPLLALPEKAVRV